MLDIGEGGNIGVSSISSVWVVRFLVLNGGVSGILTTFILLTVLMSFSSIFRRLPNQKSKMAAPKIPIVKSILSMK